MSNLIESCVVNDENVKLLY